MRRAMSCVYCAPKSRTAILSAVSTDDPRLPRTTQLLRLLENLPFSLDRRSDDQLRLLQLPDTLSADRAHARPDGADEVEGAVLGERRTEQDLLERARDADADTGAAGQVLVRRRHAPVIAAARRLDGTGEGGADHDGVGAGGQCLADVATRRHAAVRDDRHVAPRPLVVEVSRGGGVRGGRHLRHAEPENLAARTGGTRTDADQQCVDAALHPLEARLVRDDVTDDEGDGELLLELPEIDGRVLGGDVSRGGNGRLHDEDVGAGLLGDLGEALGALRNG